ncbi:MAG: T9SS type A sorting domain-containing protein [Bacteroidetes bacterium]|nr:T9SS type A sorting domain-containing protein [Bacteroidota bacterium]
MRYLLFPIFISMFLTTYSQVDDIVWQQCFGTDEKDNPQCIEKTSNGYILGVNIETDGSGISNYHDKSDIWIVNTDSIGNILWERCYGGSEGDGVNKIVAANEDSYYIFGCSWSNDGDVQNTRPGSLWVLKIDAMGNIIWENNYGSLMKKEDDRDALLTPDGGLLIMCRIMNAGGDISTYYGSNDIWICKIDSMGKIEWEKTLGNYGLDNAINMILTSDTNILIVGGHYESGGMIQCPDLGNEGADVWIVKLDMAGNVLQQFCYGGSYDDLGWDIIETNDGYVFVASTFSNDGDVSGFHGIAGDIHATDIWVCKIDFYGNLIWQWCLGGSEYDIPTYITQTENKGYIVFGETFSQDGDISYNHSSDWDSDIWMIKLDSAGNLEWEHCFGGIATERFWGVHAVMKNNDDNFVILGRSEYADGDVECDLYGWSDEDAWIFEIKDCSQYILQTPIQPFGPDTLCTTTDSISTYAINTAAGAWSYEWSISPPEAGTLNSDSTLALLHWAANWEGQAEIKVRSWNDCGNSEWSEVRNSWAYSCLGVGDIQQTKPAFVLFPNPAGTLINCRLQIASPACGVADCKSLLFIYDIFGRQQEEVQILKRQKQVKIDVSAYPAGIYIAVLKNEKEVLGRKKFVVK